MFSRDNLSTHNPCFSDYSISVAMLRTQATCMVCFDTFPLQDMLAASCQHYFCHPCWRGYTSAAIAGGPACLDLRCPIPKCGAAVRVPLDGRAQQYSLQGSVVQWGFSYHNTEARYSAFQSRTASIRRGSAGWGLMVRGCGSGFWAVLGKGGSCTERRLR